MSSVFAHLMDSAGPPEPSSEQEADAPKPKPSASVSRSNSGGVDTADRNADARLRLDLERAGRCPDCGVQTHRLSHESVQMASKCGGDGPSTAVIVHKEPLTVGEEVYKGRCLLCRPFSSSSRRSGSNGRSSSRRGSGGRRSSAGEAAGSSRAAHQNQAPAQRPHVISQEEPLPLPEVVQPQEPDDAMMNDDEEDLDDNEILSILLRMRRSPHDLALQISSFHSLWVLSWETENARAIGRVGGIPILLECLHYHLHAHLNINNRYNRNNHTSSPSALQRMQLQANGMATLQNLSVNKYNKEKLMDDGAPGIPIILTSMTSFVHNAEIVSSGCAALANILSNGTCYRLPMLNHGALNVVLRSIEYHKDNEGLVRAAYKCLCLLGQKSTARREFRRMEQGECTTDDERSVDPNDEGMAAAAGRGDTRGGGGGPVMMGIGESDDEDALHDMDVSARSALSSCSEESPTAPHYRR